MSPTRTQDPEREPERVVVRDKRRLDPLSGQLREPVIEPVDDSEAAAAAAVEADTAAVEADTAAVLGAVSELTADLQRLSAEYANYRKRVERDRVAVLEMATASLLADLLPLLDDIERARAHGDLTGGFKGVGDKLEAVTVKRGLERFGEVGEPFDPQVHEAVMQAEPDPTASVAVCAMVLQPGFRLGSRVLRPARVAVAEPAGTGVGSDPAGTAGEVVDAELLAQAPAAAGPQQVPEG